ncbi:CPR4 (YCR069W) and CPR8 (YNR028W) [Zygosaccharomyces parabailii]|nr:CPR4 (YCR069W) and CPR8 (YNR028W) [Zygosaccharomyces parabailii]CDH10977.1 related to Peptidyl-prolyl cis-trans isomerase CPR4 [Zygosaccharomyces bailii ISA1307]
MFAKVILFWLWASLSLAFALPPVIVGSTKTTPGQVDKDRFYEPNPPTTHNVLIVLEYFDEDQQKLVEQEMILELYGTVAPKTVKNFAMLGKGIRVHYEGAEEGQVETVSYKDSLFHHLIPGKLIQGGEIVVNNIPFSIYNGNWNVENFDLKHDRPGRLSMANDGPEAQNSQFFITTGLEPEQELDGKYVVFGQVVAGLDKLIQKIQYVPVDGEGKPEHDIKLKYVLVYESVLADSKAMHSTYLQDLEDYKNGDVTKGITMASTFAEGREEEKELNDIKFNDLHHPLAKVLIGVLVLLIVYVMARGRKASKLIRRRI